MTVLEYRLSPLEPLDTGEMATPLTVPNERPATISRGTIPKSLSGMPDDMLSDAARRLGWVGMLYAVGFFLVYFVTRLAMGQATGLVNIRGGIAAASIVMGVAVFVYSKRQDVPAARILNLGLAFEVVGALGIAASEFWGVFPVLDDASLMTGFVGIPWECVWIIGFPLVAPNTPRRILAASLAAASAGPVVILLSVAAGQPPPDASPMEVAGFFLFTTYVCAAIAYMVSRNVARFGARLQRARDVGSYHLLQRLSHGGMGEVWAARHRMLARPSAIKLIRPEILGASEESRTTAIKRFEREAKATARLTSPHTVVVYDFGTTVNGSFYYAMELLNGIDLDSLVDRFGPVEPARAVFLLSQACDSLQEAHDVGLIHRDVKPANMLACRIGRQHDFVKVLDFGLVKTLEAADRNTQLTGEIITGTPAYMAPEQATDVSQVDHRTDIYALGCVLYWLVTGHQVFGNNSPMATIADHITSKPVVPSRRAEVEIPPAMDQLILDCLEKRPDDRPQSVAEVQAQLTDLVTDAWTPARADAWWESHVPLATSEDVLASGATPLGVVRVR